MLKESAGKVGLFAPAAVLPSCEIKLILTMLFRFVQIEREGSGILRPGAQEFVPSKPAEHQERPESFTDGIAVQCLPPTHPYRSDIRCCQSSNGFMQLNQ